MCPFDPFRSEAQKGVLGFSKQSNKHHLYFPIYNSKGTRSQNRWEIRILWVSALHCVGWSCYLAFLLTRQIFFPLSESWERSSVFSSPAWSASWQPSSPGSPSTASLTTTSVWRESSLTGQYNFTTTLAIVCFCPFQSWVIKYFNKQLITSGLNL